MKGLRKREGSNTSNHKNDGLMEDRFFLCDNEGPVQRGLAATGGKTYSPVPVLALSGELYP